MVGRPQIPRAPHHVQLRHARGPITFAIFTFDKGGSVVPLLGFIYVYPF